MEKKNTVLLTVIAVATLLVAVVGATFAYFTATTTPTGNTGTVDTSTTTVSGVNLNYQPITTSVKKLEYPGGYAYTGVNIALTKADTTDTKEYNVSYKIKMEFKNETKTELTWTLYRADSATEITDSRTCTVNNDAPAEGAVEGAVYYQYNCTGTNTYGTQVQTGTIAADTTTATEVITTAAQTQTTDATTGAYYYLVVDYPNSGNQNDDQGKAIVASITGVDSVVQAAKA